jgi:Mrp family chromosome partitioning ATPase
MRIISGVPGSRGLGLTASSQTDNEASQKMLPAIPERPAPVADGSTEKISQELIKFVQQVFMPAGTAAPQVIVVAAIEAGNGCSWVCARIAEFLASHVDGSVCLVEANARSSSAGGRLQPDGAQRMVDSEWLFAPVRHKLHPMDEANLWLLSHTPVDGGWQRPGSLERFQARLADLRKDFTYVLVDAPPINACADASLFGRMADGLVMVLEANKTRRESAQRAKRTLDAAGVNVLGAVLNKRKYPIPDFLYRRL